MKLGAIITKKEFLRLAPLGLEAFYDGGTYSYCRANAEAFKKWTEEHGVLPSGLIPGYIIKSQPRDVSYNDFPDGVTHVHIRGSWEYFDNNDCVVAKLPTKLLKQKQI